MSQHGELEMGLWMVTDWAIPVCNFSKLPRDVPTWYDIPDH